MPEHLVCCMRAAHGPRKALLALMLAPRVQVPLLVARYADHKCLAERLRAAITVHQRNDTAALAGLAFASVLERMTVWGEGVKVSVPRGPATALCDGRELAVLQTEPPHTAQYQNLVS